MRVSAGARVSVGQCAPARGRPGAGRPGRYPPASRRPGRPAARLTKPRAGPGRTLTSPIHRLAAMLLPQAPGRVQRGRDFRLPGSARLGPAAAGAASRRARGPLRRRAAPPPPPRRPAGGESGAPAATGAPARGSAPCRQEERQRCWRGWGERARWRRV